jgi:ribonuclease D
MGDKIVAELKAKGRYAWFTESCEAAREKVAGRDDSRDDQWRISGSGKLEPYGLACLRGLWHWRDKEAEAWDRPSFMVATNRDLIEWSTMLSEGKNIDLPRHFRSDRIKRFKETLAELKGLPKNEWPARPLTKRRKRDREFDQRVDAMIARRNKLAAELDIDGSLIASRSVIEAIAANEAQPGDVLMQWQRSLLEM